MAYADYPVWIIGGDMTDGIRYTTLAAAQAAIEVMNENSMATVNQELYCYTQEVLTHGWVPDPEGE